MSLLYMVTESDVDADFYRLCAEQFGRRKFSWFSALRNRKGNGSAAVQKQLEYALRDARTSAQGEEEVCFIAAIDNDRSPHPENARTLEREKLQREDQAREARLPWMEATVSKVLGANQSAWPFCVALAVPVEMLESWTVKALDAERPGGPTPHFSWQVQTNAQAYYQPAQAPLQWKNLEHEARELTDHAEAEDFYRHVVMLIAADTAILRRKSPSFEHFHAQLTAWP